MLFLLALWSRRLGFRIIVPLSGRKSDWVGCAARKIWQRAASLFLQDQSHSCVSKYLSSVSGLKQSDNLEPWRPSPTSILSFADPNKFAAAPDPPILERRMIMAYPGWVSAGPDVGTACPLDTIIPACLAIPQYTRRIFKHVSLSYSGARSRYL